MYNFLFPNEKVRQKFFNRFAESKTKVTKTTRGRKKNRKINAKMSAVKNSVAGVAKLSVVAEAVPPSVVKKIGAGLEKMIPTSKTGGKDRPKKPTLVRPHQRAQRHKVLKCDFG